MLYISGLHVLSQQASIPLLTLTL